jgi:hypothetical protein
VGGAQQADQVQPPFQAGVELVRIPIRVLDDKGRFVKDLTRDDFRVFEDGTPQPIATFDLKRSIDCAGNSTRANRLGSSK